MESVLIIADTAKVDAQEMSLVVEKWLSDHSFLPIRGWNFGQPKPEFACVLGGDGFITRNNLFLAHLDIPFFAINFGEKGFLAVAEKDDWQDSIEKILNGRYTIERRPILSVIHYHDTVVAGAFTAAGNVYLRHKADMILLSVSIDGKVIYKELAGDGVIVANATGATAYNLSAGGAIISSGLVVTPICSHALNIKSLPVSEFVKIEIVYHGRKSSFNQDEGCLLFVDSEKYPIVPGDRVVIQKTQKTASFIIPEGFSFIESLQKKLGLSR